MQLYIGMCKQNGGMGVRESWRQLGILGWAKTRRWGLGISWRSKRKPVPPSSIRLAKVSSRWDDGAQELGLPWVSATLYPSLPYQKFPWVDSISFLLHKESCVNNWQRKAEEKSGPTSPSSYHYNGQPSRKPSRINKTSAFPRYLYLMRFHTRIPK